MAADSFYRNTRRIAHRFRHWRACIVACLLLFSICLPAAEIPETDTIERNQDTLRRCIGLLVTQLEIILELVAQEDVSAELQSAIAGALNICREILDALKYR